MKAAGRTLTVGELRAALEGFTDSDTVESISGVRIMGIDPTSLSTLLIEIDEQETAAYEALETLTHVIVVCGNPLKVVRNIAHKIAVEHGLPVD
jgi:hypothetical protein